MKNRFTFIKGIGFILIAVATLTVADTYCYVNTGEVYVGRFTDNNGNIEPSHGDGKELTDFYIKYNKMQEEGLYKLDKGSINITINNRNNEDKNSDISYLSNKFDLLKIQYKINQEEWSKPENLIFEDEKFVFNKSDFNGGTFKFRIVAQRKSDSTDVITDEFTLNKLDAQMSYIGNNEYLGCDSFKLISGIALEN